VGVPQQQRVRGTAFTSYGAFWLSFWAFEQFFVKDVPMPHLGDAVGVYLIGWAIFTGYMWVASSGSAWPSTSYSCC